MTPFVIHAHFYQPDRSNPWTGVLEAEPSAAPDRDWNTRIHRECYRPNAFARIYDTQRRVERIVNNFERLSFNVGPTLLSWLEANHPDTYARIIDGDWRSVSRLGHGNAVAQPYHHVILPLAQARDRVTQIRWGLADFAHRFGRQAEGMWLPETAADRATIDALIDEGVRFTVLAPHQAARVRRPTGEWEPAGAVDVTQPYRHLHSDGSGRWLAVFLYDDALARSLAFDPTTSDAHVLVERLAAAGDGGFVNVALDGETFGHHHPFGELGLAYALSTAADQRGLRPTNYAAALAERPPELEVALADEATSWSCEHGVARWQRDCGCATRSQPGWDQRWRTPLRAALDVVRDAAHGAFAERGAELLKDPWAARDDYLQVRLGAWSRAEFLERHAPRQLPQQRQVELWTLLEAQRHALAMYASCAWFFADVADIEPVYALRSAARVLHLVEECGVKIPRAEVLDRLATAKVNRPRGGTGADVWRQQVEPAAVDHARVAAHLSLLRLVEDLPDTVHTGGHTASLRDHRGEARGRVGLSTARVAVSDDATTSQRELVVAAVHLGGLDFHGVVARAAQAAAGGDETLSAGDRFATAAGELWEAFPTAPVAKLLRLVDQLADGLPPGIAREFDLEAALPDGRQRIVEAIFSDLTWRFHEAYARLYHDHRRVLEMLVAAGYELPRDLRAAAELTLTGELERQLAAALGRHDEGVVDPAQLEAVRRTLDLARSQGYELDVAAVADEVSAAVTAAARAAAASLDVADAERLERWLELCHDLGLDVDLSMAQEVVYEAATRARAGRLGIAERDVVAQLGERLGLAPAAWSPIS